MILGSAKLAYILKQKSLLIPKKLVLGTFEALLKVSSTKVNLLYLIYLATQRCRLLHLIKQNCFLQTFLGNPILTTQVYPSMFVLRELI